MTAKNLYRRVSVTRMNGEAEAYDARIDIESDRQTGVVTYKVFSQALPDRWVTFRSTGNASDDNDHLETMCQHVYEFDQNYRVRAVPKVRTHRPHTLVTGIDVCGLCGGAGYVEDETGYPMVCECRG